MPSVAVCAIVTVKMITIDPPRSPSSFDLPMAGLNRFLKRVRASVGIGEIDVLLADDVTLRRLNRRWRGKNATTDVLSFPAGGDNLLAAQEMAGDLAISLDAAARQALEQKHDLADEVRILILHGALHLAGYDHETDSGEMAEREAELRKELRLPVTLIARAQGVTPANGTRSANAKRRPASTASKASGKVPLRTTPKRRSAAIPRAQ